MKKQKLPRGFVKEAEQYAEDYRSELGLQNNDPICPFKLAAHLAVPVTKFTEEPCLPNKILEQLKSSSTAKISAFTLKDGTYSEIWVNDLHGHYRTNSSLAHELAHVILSHPEKPPLTGNGCRDFDAALEEEANVLGWTILVPKPAVIKAVTRFNSKREAGDFYGVSPEMLEYRIRKTGVRRFLRYTAW